MELVQPNDWPRPAGYANGIAAQGRVMALSGQIGWNPRTREFESDDFVAQVRQALLNIAEVIHAAGARVEHIVRLTWYITDRNDYQDNQRAIGETYRAIIGKHFPAMSVVIVAGLLELQAKVEIEATAVVP